MFEFLRHRPHLLSAVCILFAGGFGLVLGRSGLVGLAGCLMIIVAGLVFWKPELAFIASLGSMVVGQIIRLPILGGDNGVIINDLLLPVLIVSWLLRGLLARHLQLPRHSLTLPMVGMIVTMVLSILVNSGAYTSSEILSGILYQIRWVEYAFILIMGFEYFRSQSRAWRYLVFTMILGVIVALLGFVQLKIFPDFSFMVPQGWDPHVGRLLSTWFDPNFLAGWLAFLVTIALAVALGLPWKRAKWWWGIILILLSAIVLTFSRSGYVALLVGTGLVAIIRSRTMFFLGVLAMFATILFVPRVQERVIGIRTVDETAKLRIVSWQNAFEVIGDYPVLGVGYNLYRYVQVDYGFLQDTKEHSASGSDSSLLSIWVTTGLIGFAMFLWLVIAMFREAWKTWHDQRLPREWQGFGLGVFAGLFALLFHAQFVNGLFYPHIMQTIWLMLAIVIMVRQPHARA